MVAERGRPIYRTHGSQRLILGIKQKGYEGKNQIHPALVRDNYWILVNTIINFEGGDFFIFEYLKD
jgi:hypothetical protein